MSGFSPAHVAWIAQNTLRAAVRQRVHHVFLLIALAFVVGARWLGDFNFGAPELKFIADCGLAAMAFFGAALTISATAQLVLGELEQRTALTLLAKPVRRSEFVLGKLFGVIGLNTMFCAITAFALAVLIAWRQRELAGTDSETIRYPSLAIAALLQWLKLSVLAAFTLLVASYARTQLFTVATGFLIFMICHLQHLAHDAYVRADAAWERAAAALASWVFPNFQVFALADSLAAADAPAWGHVGRVAVYAVAYVVAAGGLAVVSFNRREL